MIRIISSLFRASATAALVAGALAASGCMSKKERTTRNQLENANGLIEQADIAASQCQNAQMGDAQADQNVTSAAGDARVAQRLCGKSAALNQQAAAAVNASGVP